MTTTPSFFATSKQTLADLQAATAQSLTDAKHLAELNLAALQGSAARTAQAARSVFSAATPKDALAAHAAFVEAEVAQAAAHARTVYDHCAASGAQLREAAAAKVAEGQAALTEAWASFAKQVPSQAQGAVAAVTQAVAATQKAAAAVQAEVKAGVEQAEQHLVTALTSVAAKKSGAKRK